MKINYLGVCSNTGALKTGPELTPPLFRQLKLQEKLNHIHDLKDLGDLNIDNEAFRHNLGPIRNWPGPLMMWQKIQDISPFIKDEFSLVVGGGCSTITGLFSAFYHIYKEQAHILTVDNHIDIKIPDPRFCIGATAFSLYFLTYNNQWFTKPECFNTTKITSMAFDPQNIEGLPTEGIQLFDKDIIQAKGPEYIADAYLSSLAPNARVMIQFDLDAISEDDLSTVYMPSASGMPMDTIKLLLKRICSDSRIKALVVTEFDASKDSEHQGANKVMSLITDILKEKVL